MHSELVDTLRCLSVHEESWLVAAADETEGRHIMRGLLGCPVCHARYPIAHGIADFSGGARVPVALDDGDGSSGEDAAIRLAAMLDLTDSSGYVILVGSWARLGAALREVVPVMVLAVNPHPDAAIGDGVSGVTTLDRIPVAASSARAIAYDAPGPIDEQPLDLGAALGAVRPGGRIVATTAVDVPDDVAIVARDAEHWVATRTSGAPLIRLVRNPA
ncbi:MAG TPA: hypothetical protein VFN39_02210 [Gemmatimonadaceae bacterium]|nr:hypothetical protein [Gemmatimonadaceae bacterium]